MTPSESITDVLSILQKRFPGKGAMEIGTPYQNLVAVMLSARTRDEQVLKLLPAFFVCFPTIESLAQAKVEEIISKVNTIGMYRQKAKFLHIMAKDVIRKFNGEIPHTMEELVSLAGVGRKTASVVLVISFGKKAIAVDTHVHRVTNRLGWVKTTHPEKTEKALLTLIPKKWHQVVNRVFVKHGRYICLPGKPRCFVCPIRNHFSYLSKTILSPSPEALKRLEEEIERREKIVTYLRESLS